MELPWGCWRFLSLILIFCMNYGVESKRVEGVLTSSSDWHFLTRFCFLSSKGTMRYTFEYPKSYGVQDILLYYDESNQWDGVYASSLTCDQRVAVLDPANNQIISLSVLFGWSGCTEITRSGTQYISCEGGRVFRSTRERWWFIAVSRCDQSSGPGGVNLSYTIHMTNGKTGDMLHREFSADEFYILPIDIAFIGIYGLLLAGAIVCAVILRSRQLFHTTYKLYMIALVFYLVYLFFMCVANGIYSQTGYEQFALDLLGRVFGALSDLTFLLMLILVGKGFTITRGRLPSSSSIKVAVFFTLYVITYIALFIYEAEAFDPALVLYIYESPAGYGLICLRLIGWMWFCYSVFFTVKHYKTKSLFYYPFVIFYSFWFWASPLIILVAMFAVDQWIREKAVHGVELFVALAGHIFFQILTRPQAANKNFPYHVRTTQIACMTGSNAHELDNFNSHAYSVSNDGPLTSGPDLTSLFTTSKTRSDKAMESEMSASSSNATVGLPPSYSTAQLMGGPSNMPSRRESAPATLSANAIVSAPPSYHALFTVTDQ